MPACTPYMNPFSANVNHCQMLSVPECRQDSSKSIELPEFVGWYQKKARCLSLTPCAVIGLHLRAMAAMVHLVPDCSAQPLLWPCYVHTHEYAPVAILLHAPCSDHCDSHADQAACLMQQYGDQDADQDGQAGTVISIRHTAFLQSSRHLRGSVFNHLSYQILFCCDDTSRRRVLFARPAAL